MTQTRVTVRKLFWDALELALETQVHRLAKDIASSLGQSEDPLLKALKSERVSAALLEDARDEEVEDLAELRCEALVPVAAGSPFLTRCCQPVLWTGSPLHALNRCLQHSLQGSGPAPPAIVKRIEREEEPPLYVEPSTGYVYSESGTQVGRFRPESNRILMFKEAEAPKS